MNDMIVKSVDLMGDTIMATQDEKGYIWAGVSYFCNALGMQKWQKDKQIHKVQSDKTLRRGCSKFGAGVFDPNNETVALRIDFIPMWLSKITITDKMEQDHPDLADKLLNYQLKAKDILAAAFLPKQSGESGDLRKQIQVIAKGTDELYQKVDALDKKLETALLELPLLGVESDKVDKALKQRGVEVVGGKESNAYHDKRLLKRVYWDIHGQLRREFQVGTYKAIKRNQTDLALKFLSEYQLPLALREEVETANAQQRLDV